MRLLSLFFLIFSFSKVYAVAPTVTSITGVSAFVTTPTVIAYGGMGGLETDSACATKDNLNTCNSCPATCATSPLCACNETRIYTNLAVRVYVTPPSGVSGNIIGAWSGTGGSDVISVSPNASYFEIPWSAICSNMTTPSADCETASGQAALNLYIDRAPLNDVDTNDGDPVQVTFKIARPGTTDDIASTDGITDFTPYPGDEKVFIEDPLFSGGFPLLDSGVSVKTVRVYIADTAITDAVPGAGLEPKDLTVLSASSELNDNIVDGLENGIPYVLRVGLIDDANNISLFYPPPSGSGGLPACDSNPPDPATCPYAVIPDAVLGLLTDDFNCFVATAAYGTGLEPKLKLFREFRQKILLPTEWGRTFVKAYYNYGPKAAQWIHDKPVVRAVTRGLLWPVYFFSYLALKIGFAFAFALSLVAVSSLLVLSWLSVRRVFGRA